MENTDSLHSKKIVSWSNVIFILFCLAVFYFIVHNFTELKAVQKLFDQVDGWWIIVAIIAQIFTYLFTALVYYFLLNKFKDRTPVTINDLFKLSIVTVFINQIVPSGGIGGNGFLFNELSNRHIPSKKAFFTIIMECLYLYVALALLLLTLPITYLIGHGPLPEVFVIIILFGFVLYGVLAIIMTILSFKKTMQRVLKKLSRFRFIKNYIENIDFSPEGTFNEYGSKGPWGVFLKYKKQSVIVIAGQLGVFFADSFTIVALLHGLHVHIAYIVIALGLLLTFVTAALPISPGALLLYEGAMTYFYTTMGMPFDTALIITLLFRVLSFWASIIIGLALYKNVQTNKG